MLGAVILALHDCSGRIVRDADRGLGPVDVLTARPARPIDVDAQIGRVDVDLDVVLDLGRDEHRGEGRVATIAGVERRLAHEAVDPGLGAQPAVGVFAVEPTDALLMPATSPGGRLDEFGLEAVASPQRRYMRSSISAQS